MIQTIITCYLMIALTISLAIWEAIRDKDKLIYNHIPRWLRRASIVLSASILLHLIQLDYINSICYGDAIFNHIVLNISICCSMGLLFIVVFNMYINQLKGLPPHYVGKESYWDRLGRKVVGYHYIVGIGSLIFLIIYLGYIFQNC